MTSFFVIADPTSTSQFLFCFANLAQAVYLFYHNCIDDIEVRKAVHEFFFPRKPEINFTQRYRKTDFNNNNNNNNNSSSSYNNNNSSSRNAERSYNSSRYTEEEEITVKSRIKFGGASLSAGGVAKGGNAFKGDVGGPTKSNYYAGQLGGSNKQQQQQQQQHQQPHQQQWQKMQQMQQQQLLGQQQQQRQQQQQQMQSFYPQKQQPSQRTFSTSSDAPSPTGTVIVTWDTRTNRSSQDPLQSSSASSTASGAAMPQQRAAGRSTSYDPMKYL